MVRYLHCERMILISLIRLPRKFILARCTLLLAAIIGAD